MKHLITLLIVLLTPFAFGQDEGETMRFSGEINDTINNKPVKDAVIMAVRTADGMLLGFTHSKADGSFVLEGVPIDTMELIVSHYKYAEKRYIIVGSDKNKRIDIPNIVLPQKATTLDEVIIYANTKPIYFRGDTLVYTADSFEVRQGAMVEDLLKNLPGISVDDDGNISSGGRQVTKVLVDGDEFFGSDPTIATRNLNAEGVDKVEIYETEDETAGGNSEEKIQVMNIELKDGAKTGFFGKIAASGGANSEYFQDKPNGQLFYEGDVLFNYFSSKMKVSVFGLGSNTPNTGFSYNEASRFGLTNEMSGGWRSILNPSRLNGLPENYKGGFYFTNEFTDKFQMGLNYTYNDSRLATEQVKNSEYFFGDTTTYTREDSIRKFQHQQSHTVNFSLEYNFDSKTSLELKSNLVIRNEFMKEANSSNYLTPSNQKFSANNFENKSDATGLDGNVELRFRKEFDKRNRELDMTYQFGYTESDRDNKILTESYYSQFITPDSLYDQTRNIANHTTGHRLLVNYTEPIAEKFRLKFQYKLDYFYGRQATKTYDKSATGYDDYAGLFSNDFSNTRLENRGGIGIQFVTRTQKLEIGSRLRNVVIDNLNNENSNLIQQNETDILPYLEYTYEFSRAEQLRFNYTTSSSQPSLNQLQPVRDNTNPNNLVEGNPNLTPSYTHALNLFYRKWNALEFSYVYAGGYFQYTNNAFSNSIAYFTDGRSISKSINVDGNMFGGFYVGGGIPLHGRELSLKPGASGNYTNYKSIINNENNRTQNYKVDGSLEFEYRTDSIEISLSASLSYNYPMSSLSMGLNDPYTIQSYKLDVFFELPFRFFIESDAEYQINSRRAEGYNATPFIWNAKLSRRFLKTGNLVFNVAVYDIFNQNIGISRNVGTNIITDVRSIIIARYFMVGATWRFNNRGTKVDTKDNGFF